MSFLFDQDFKKFDYTDHFQLPAKQINTMVKILRFPLHLYPQVGGGHRSSDSLIKV